MSSLESLAFAWAERGWLALLAITAAMLIVAVLRKPCRHWFGAERAFQLWTLPTLALLASQLPHAATASTPLPLVVAITSVVTAALPRIEGADRFEWHVGALLLWLVGMVVVLALAVVAQHRYRQRLRSATPFQARLGWPVLLAADVDTGPALVGAWRSRIVLPLDFSERYDATEQMLILAHESAHARRGDGWWSLFAHMLVAPLWFHPLVWWALAAFRHDQEMACDAVVLREHGTQRRSYASAMLKSPSIALALPVGCTWSPRHPLTERIAMLKMSLPCRARRNAGMVVGSLFACFFVGVVYAASAPVQGAVASANTTREYQLDLNVELGTNDGPARHTERMKVALCMASGKTGTMVTNRDWRIDATPSTEGDNRLRIDVVVAVAGKQIAKSRLNVVLGESTHAIGKSGDGNYDYAIVVTPVAGCPARAVAAGH